MQGKRGSPRGHSPHPQAAPRLLSRLVLPLLHNACDAILYFSAVWAVSARLTTVPWWIKSGDYKNIQMDQIGFQESLNQSKLKNCKRTKPLGYLWRKKKKEGDLDRGGGWRWRWRWRWWWQREEEVEVEEEEEEGRVRVNQGCFWVIQAWNATASITEWLRAIWLCLPPFSRREEDIMDKQWLCQVQIGNIHIYSVTLGQQQLY